MSKYSEEEKLDYALEDLQAKPDVKLQPLPEKVRLKLRKRVNSGWVRLDDDEWKAYYGGCGYGFIALNDKAEVIGSVYVDKCKNIDELVNGLKKLKSIGYVYPVMFSGTGFCPQKREAIDFSSQLCIEDIAHACGEDKAKRVLGKWNNTTIAT